MDNLSSYRGISGETRPQLDPRGWIILQSSTTFVDTSLYIKLSIMLDLSSYHNETNLCSHIIGEQHEQSISYEPFLRAQEKLQVSQLSDHITASPRTNCPSVSWKKPHAMSHVMIWCVAEICVVVVVVILLGRLTLAQWS